MPAAVTTPRRMTVIRSAMASTSPSLWLMNTTLRPSAAIEWSVAEQLLDLLRGEDRGRLVHDQDACPAVEQLQDLDPLLLADGELPDLRPRVDAHAELVGERGDLGLGTTDVQPEPAAGRARAGCSR